jgi:hypothetical protein
MVSDIDILTIDTNIKQIFTDEYNNLTIKQQNLNDLQNSLKLENLSNQVRNSIKKNIKELKNYIENVSNKTDEYFYYSESANLIEEYKKILSTPLKMNFMGKPKKNTLKKNIIISQYINIAKKYVDIFIEPTLKKHEILCNNNLCNNNKNFDIIEGSTYICLECGAQQEVFFYTSSYKDIDRVNISAKYTYDRKIHFRDGINQYQGKQNCTIEQEIYNNLINEFEKHHLLIGNKNTPKESRFKNIEKEHVQLFLKELGYCKHYENINLIHFNLTGKKPDNIFHLEDKLLQDFEILTDLYDKKYKHKIDRKNFLNTQFILFQLLCRHKHPCNKEDFAILKTIDRKSFHDTVTSELFTSLGWTFTSI